MLKNFWFVVVFIGVLYLCSPCRAESLVYVDDYVFCLEYSVKVKQKDILAPIQVQSMLLAFWDFPTCPPLPKLCDWRYVDRNRLYGVDVIYKGPHCIIFLDNYTKNGSRVCRRVFFLLEGRSIATFDLDTMNRKIYPVDKRRKLTKVE